MTSECGSEKVRRRGEFVGRVIEQKQLGSAHQSTWIQLSGPGAVCLGQAEAGQFVEVACRDMDSPRVAAPLLRRPFSIAGLRVGACAGSASRPGAKAGETLVEIIYEVLGPGTSYLSHLRVGEAVNLLGPLGNGFSMPSEAERRVILMGGGVGLPPLFFLARQLHEAGHGGDVVALAGGRTIDALVCTVDRQAVEPGAPAQAGLIIDEFAQSRTRSIIATDDGSEGFHGNVVEAMEQLLSSHSEWCDARVYACGPEGMLRAVAKSAERRGMGCEVCMESYMACGIGVCQSCVVKMRADGAGDDKDKQDCGCGNSGGYKLACSHGPVFDARKVRWD